ncbi:TPA: DUF2523 family protein [Photobacterium damselae]
MSSLIARFLAWFAGFGIADFATYITSILIKFLVSIGFSYTVVEGVQIGFEWFINEVSKSFSTIPSDILQVLGLAGIDECFNILLTAHLFVLSVRGINKASSLVPSFKKTV